MAVSAPSPLPVLDISGFRSDPHGPAGAAFVAALREAFHGIGAAYLVGHGVPDDLVTRVRHEAEAFFALPEAERLRERAADLGTSPVALAIQFAARAPRVSSVLLGATSPAQVRENARAVEPRALSP